MKKINLFFVGMAAVLLTFGLVLAGCEQPTSGGGDGGNAKLETQWYVSQDMADNSTGSPVYEFTTEGKLFVSGTDIVNITYTAADGKITTFSNVSETPVKMGTIDYSISGTKLTLSNTNSSGLVNGTYYCKK